MVGFSAMLFLRLKLNAFIRKEKSPDNWELAKMRYGEHGPLQRASHCEL